MHNNGVHFFPYMTTILVKRNTQHATYTVQTAALLPVIQKRIMDVNVQ